MTNAALLINDSRTKAGLSLRALATRADVAWSTIARIERGEVDPTVGMLTRILAAAGRDLNLSSRHLALDLSVLSTAWSADDLGQDRPNWTALRNFVDQLELHPEHKASSILNPPPETDSLFMNNLLAAIAETISDEIGLSPPRWTSRIPKMPNEWISPGTARMQARERSTTLPHFKDRNLIIGAENLWRTKYGANA